jgi:PAS domain S-box-containing protein
MFMLESLKRLLAPPLFEEDEKNTAAQLLHWLLIVASIIEVFSLVIIALFSSSRTPFVLAALSINAVSFYFLRRGNLRVGSIIFVGLLWLLLTVNGFRVIGIYSPTLSVYTLCIILAAVLLHEKVGILVGFLSSFAVAGMVIAHRNGLLPMITELSIIPEVSMTAYLVTFAGTGTLLYFTAGRIRRAFVSLMENEQILAERNREMENQIREREEVEMERDSFFELSVDLFAIASADGYFRRLNPAFHKTLGYLADELSSKPFLEFVHPDDVESTRKEFSTILEGTISYDFENRYRCKDGSYRWLAWSSYPQNGKVYAVAKDITERKTTEQALRASEERYRLLFENTEVPTFIYSREGKILMVNARAAQVLRTKPEEAVGRALDEFFPRPQVVLFYERIDRVLTTGVNNIYEDTVELGGQRRWYLSNFQALHDEQGARFAAQVIVHDITILKQAEEKEQELALAKEKSTFLTEFLANISHDLKTPLTTINTSLALLERITDPTRQRDKIQQISEQVEMVEKFIQDILMVSRLDHLPALERATFPLNELISNITEKLRPKIEKKQITLTLDLASDLPSIWADYSQLQRVFVNLVENALNYTPNSGRVDVRTYMKDQIVTVEIMDTGIGIAAEDLPHIFDRFYRADKARRLEQGGTGLGLAIVKKLLEMHEAAINVDSTPDKGTTFRVEIPVRQEEAVGS